MTVQSLLPSSVPPIPENRIKFPTRKVLSLLEIFLAIQPQNALEVKTLIPSLMFGLNLSPNSAYPQGPGGVAECDMVKYNEMTITKIESLNCRNCDRRVSVWVAAIMEFHEEGGVVANIQLLGSHPSRYRCYSWNYRADNPHLTIGGSGNMTHYGETDTSRPVMETVANLRFVGGQAFMSYRSVNPRSVVICSFVRMNISAVSQSTSSILASRNEHWNTEDESSDKEEPSRFQVAGEKDTAALAQPLFEMKTELGTLWKVKPEQLREKQGPVPGNRHVFCVPQISLFALVCCDEECHCLLNLIQSKPCAFAFKARLVTFIVGCWIILRGKELMGGQSTVTNISRFTLRRSWGQMFTRPADFPSAPTRFCNRLKGQVTEMG
ncbi:hypothetical protein J6590_064148 [Homalodisca vitripennis]|nr:hypothetical protein J6590_064148 [Homalodisca vitripennis]